MVMHIDTYELTKIINFWREVAVKIPTYPREIVDKISLTNPEIVDLTGVRRSGKSSVLKLLIQETNDWFYMNFEDPFFLSNNEPGIIESLLETSAANFGVKPRFVFLDEVQNIRNWESAVRKLRDSGDCKVFVTGSSAKLLSHELATLLSGRHLSYEVFPLSFGEFLKFRKIGIASKKDLIVKERKLIKNFDDYLQIGGFPEIVISQNSELVKQYYGDIVQKDVIKRYEIRDKSALEQMGAYLISAAGKTISQASLQNQFRLNYETAAAYLSYFKDSFLIFELPQFSYSLKTIQKALKKIYCIDTGLANNVSFKFSQNHGQMLENAVFLQLRRAKKDLYYFQGSNENEVDFVVKDKERIIELIQVCWDVSNKKTLDREMRSLKEAAGVLGCNKLTILTHETRGERKAGNLKVGLIPVFEWTLSI